MVHNTIGSSAVEMFCIGLYMHCIYQSKWVLLQCLCKRWAESFVLPRIKTCVIFFIIIKLSQNLKAGVCSVILVQQQKRSWKAVDYARFSWIITEML